VLVLFFGALLAVKPLLSAAGQILTTFLLVPGLTHLTSISFIVRYLLTLPPSG
jgi:RND superfamily putative drug exporter